VGPKPANPIKARALDWNLEKFLDEMNRTFSHSLSPVEGNIILD
jgi:hypothetical protein